MTAIEVHLDLPDGAVLAGIADLRTSRGATVSSFRYERSYLAGPGWDLSPDLPVTATETVLDHVPGALADAAPDAWGRNLITRRHARRWTGHAPPPLSEAELLLAVSDATRQGALRLSLGDGFVADAGVPQMIELERLLQAAAEVAADAPDADRRVEELLDAGSGSLGGARPKAAVASGEQLWIAKFPHPEDRWDVMRWEAVALDLAEACGLAVAAHRLEVVASTPVLLSERFDRAGRARIAYLSARSLVGAGGRPGDYLEVAEAVADHGIQVTADLRELWARMSFSVAINNTDDHLRNHGFLRRGAGWALSPLFDVNPDPSPGAQRATSIRGAVDALECRAALFEVCEPFGLERAAAEQVWRDQLEVIGAWREVARARGIAEVEIERFAGVLDRWDEG